MFRFYRKLFLAFLLLVSVTFALVFVCYDRIFIKDTLLPADNSVFPWTARTITGSQQNGTSSVSLNDDSFSLDYDYLLATDVMYPYVSLEVVFGGTENARYPVDLTGYSTVTFKLKCTSRNILAFHLHSFDAKVTNPTDFSSYRIAEAMTSCNEEWSKIEIDLRHLNIPLWWLERFNVEISDQSYRLDRVVAFSTLSTRNGPGNTPVNVKISELALGGYDWRYVWALTGSLTGIWAFFLFWVFRQYTRSLVMDVRDKLRKDRPLLAYQQLSIETEENTGKALLSRFIATEYANPDLNLEKIIAVTGINRTTINDILKQELGFTFTAYLNKLRLTEAARLLSEKGNVNVAEVAYSVGYRNVSYFNKLFKSEYGHTPKTFKNICKAGNSG